MKRNTLRSLGTGFLAAAILTSAFAILQGNSPTAGITIDSVFSTMNKEEITSLIESNTKLTEEVSRLEKQRNELNTEVVSLREQENKHKEEVAELEARLREQTTRQNDEETTSNETNLSPEDVESVVEYYNETGKFVISDGETAHEIADNLAEANIIQSAEEFYQLIEDWNLEAVIQVGEYTIDDSMSIHEIAEIITAGAYFYN